MNEEDKNTKKEEVKDETGCPVCSLMNAICNTHRRHSGFFTHLANARIEFLKAMRSLLDEQIDSAEQKKSDRGMRSKAQKVDIE